MSATAKPSANTKLWSTKSQVRELFIDDHSLQIVIIACSFSEFTQFSAEFHHCKASHTLSMALTLAIILSDFRTSRWIPYSGSSNHI